MATSTSISGTSITTDPTLTTTLETSSGDGDGTPGDGDGSPTTTNPTTSSGDGDGTPGDGDGDPDPTAGPKFDLGGLPDAGGLPGGFLGIPETCAQAEDAASAVGCIFFSLDNDNLSSGETQPWGIVVSNVQEDAPASVVVEVKNGNMWTNVAGPQVIAPLDLYTFTPPDNHQEGSGLKPGGAYRVTSDVPVVAYQFNPIDGQSSYTTDASLLFPVPAYDYIYQVLGYEVTIGYGSYVVVIGAVDNTMVTVTPSVTTAAGVGIPAGVPNVPFQVMLNEGDVAQIATEGAMQALTGTTIETDEDHPVGVISGTECTNTGQGACDHMEEMLTGVRLWGQEFVAGRMPIRELGNPEQTFWHIYASEDDTTVTIDASNNVTGLPVGPQVLQKGQQLELQVTGPINDPGDFHVVADKPISVMAYLIGVASGEGDPAMVQMAPVQQFLPRYVVLVPNTWINDYMVLTRLAGAQVQVDGMLVPDNEFLPVGNGDYEVARLLVPDGVYTVDGLGDPCGVVVVGFDDYDSYAYLGGVGTSVINPNPQG
jgi:hypothetical protein